MFNAGQHMNLCTPEVINCGMGVDYVYNHKELMQFAWNSEQIHLEYVVNRIAYGKGCGQIR
jgi:hypothetical protein